jgi:HlyD family secretion protein
MVQTARVARQDLQSVVVASGEIKPKNYINISASALGRIRELLVKEGDRVQQGQMLGQLESIQPGADLDAQRAAIRSAEADVSAGEAAIKASSDNVQQVEKNIERDRADLEKAQLDFNRAKTLLDNRLIARQDFEAKQMALKDADATLQAAIQGRSQAEAQLEQAKAQLAGSQSKVTQAQASLQRLTDILHDYSFYAPLNGIVTNLPVRVGETVVPGVQNSSGSTVMTIADMSLITAEVKVDETDIVTLQLGQQAEISIDAMSGQTFTGKVIEIGDTAILRSTGAAASDSAVSSQEAKDFKVVVALDAPPANIKPGLSCTARITTAVRHAVLVVPLQALTVKQADAATGSPAPGAPTKSRAERITGVFVLRQGKAEFQRVHTGISGTLEVEAVDGIAENDEIVVGPYQLIRTLRSGTQVTVDKAPAAPSQPGA